MELMTTNNNHQHDWKKMKDGITVAQLMAMLHNIQCQGCNLDAKIHTIGTVEYGKVISTHSVTGLRLELDDEGEQHILITT